MVGQSPPYGLSWDDYTSAVRTADARRAVCERRCAAVHHQRTTYAGRMIMALEPGDHIWYYDGQGNENAIAGEQTSTDKNVPRTQWFPSASPNDPNDYRDNGTHIFNLVVYDGVVRRGQPHLRHGAGSYAWLNNNPGNLTGVPGGADFGQFTDKFNWHNFLIFPDHDTGFAAIAAFLHQGPYPSLSILDAFRKYAPGGDGP